MPLLRPAGRTGSSAGQWKDALNGILRFNLMDDREWSGDDVSENKTVDAKRQAAVIARRQAEKAARQDLTCKTCRVCRGENATASAQEAQNGAKPTNQ